MAAITATEFFSKTTATTVTRTTLTASDTLTFSRGAGQTLILVNTTGSTITATLTGSTASTIAPEGYGGTLSVAAGKAVAVAANSTVALKLDNIYPFLQGNVTVTGGTDLIAHLVY